jgi:hypothetical protein
MPRPVNIFYDCFWYEAPFLQCAPAPHGSGPGCVYSAPLPYENLPRTDDERLWSQNISQLEWPSDEWRVFSGCRHCGLVAIRGRAHLVSEPVVKKSEGRFRNDVTLHYVEFPCANTGCKAPTKMYVDIPDGSVEGLLAELRGVKFHGILPCGHPIKPIPSQLCRIQQVLNRLW